jgi:hypothetical protein
MRDGRTGVQVRHAFLRSSSGPRSNPPFRFLPTVIKGIAIEANVSVMNFDITDDDVHSLRVVSRRMAGQGANCLFQRMFNFHRLALARFDNPV